MITSLHLENFKGVNGAFELGNKTLIIGPNFSGKTALLEALKLALIGQIPTGDKPLSTASAIFARASGSSLKSILECDDGRPSVTIDSLKGKLSMVSMPLFRVDSIDHQRAVALLNPNAYFSQSGPARINMLVSLISEIDAAQDLFDRISETKSDFAAQYTSKIRSLPEFRATIAPGPAKIEAVSELLKKCKSEARAIATRMKGAAQGLSDLSTIDEQIKGLPSLVEITYDLQMANESISELSKEIGSLEQRRANKVAHQKKMEDYEQSSEVNWEEKIEEAEREISALTTQIASREADMKKLQAEHKELVDKEKKKSLALKKHEADYASLVREHDKISPLEGGEWLDIDSPWSIKSGVVQRMDCVVAVTSSVNSETTIGYNGLNILAVNRLWIEKDNSEQVEKFMIEMSQLQDIIETYKESLEDIQGKLAQSEIRLNELNEQNRTDHKDKSEWVSALAGMAKQRNKGRPEEPSDPDSLETIVSKIEVSKGNWSQLSLRIDGMLQAKTRIEQVIQDRKRISQAIKERDLVQAEIDFITELEKIVKTVKTSLVDDVIEGALEIANRFTAGVLISPLVYSENQIGRVDKGVFISIDGFSGAERSLAELAFGVALASKLQNKIAVIDELSTFDDIRKSGLIRNLGQLVDEGIISQYIAVDNRESELEHEASGIKIIKTTSTPRPE